MRQDILHNAHVLHSDAQNVRHDGQNVTDSVRFSPIDRQQVMNGGGGAEHANCVAELIHEFCDINQVSLRNPIRHASVYMERKQTEIIEPRLVLEERYCQNDGSPVVELR